MATIFRRLAGPLAVVMFLNPVVGASAWFLVRKAIVRHEARRHIVSRGDRAGLVLLRFTKWESETLLRWEHSREFEYDGQMYDIVDAWAEGDALYYRCWWDRAETRLNAQLRALAARTFGAAPKFGGDKSIERTQLESADFILPPPWRLRIPRAPVRRLGGLEETLVLRNTRPLTPPPWTA
ncbi:MAG TPA: hypothetical protein PLP83_08270 [Candidatus Aminicenantes bacterium]|nr:hypothetical protein [Candidatus Aminicenantes bacterium]